MIFFTDENIIHKAALMLKLFDDRHEVQPFLEQFERGTPDEIWIPQVGGRNPKPIIVSGDGRILRIKAQRQLLRESGCIYVHLLPGWTNMPWEAYAWKIVKYWPEVVRRCETAQQQTVLALRPGGQIERINLG